MRKLKCWPPAAAVWMAFVAVVVLIAVALGYKSRADQRMAVSDYMEACQLRADALTKRASLKRTNAPLILPSGYSPKRCRCQAKVLVENFDSEMVQSVGEWFRAAALDVSDNPNKMYFARIGFENQQKLEQAYDLALRSCNAST